MVFRPKSRLWLFDGPLLWIPRMNASKRFKKTINQNRRKPDPPPIVMKPGSNPSQLGLPISWEFFFVVVGGGELGCAAFFVDDQILPEGFTIFFFRNLVREYHCLDITPKLQELKWCFWEMFLFAPYMTQHINKERHQFKWDWLSKLLFVFFFSETFPPTKPLSIWWGETTKNKHVQKTYRRTLKLPCVTPPAALPNFLSLLYLYTPQNFIIDTKHCDLF